MKKIITIFLAFVLLVSFSGCMSKEAQLTAEASALSAEVEELKNEIKTLEETRDALENEIVDKKIENNTAKYVLTLNIKQVHYSLDLADHLKDSMNDLSIQIPVDKEYYDSVDIGDTIDDSFRVGSFVFKGSLGSWKITVENKEIK